MKVLVAIDDSPHSSFCVREVAARPWPAGTEVRVLCVTGVDANDPLPEQRLQPGQLSELPVWPVASLEPREALLDSARRIAQRGVDMLTAHGLPASVRVREGIAAAQILAEAHEWPADLIVVGSHGYGAFKRLLLGSVASDVVHRAPCSVEVVRARKHD